MEMQEFVDKFSGIVSETELSPETELVDMDGWDSLGQITFIAFVRRQFGRIINVGDLSKASTVSDLFVLAKGV